MKRMKELALNPPVKSGDKILVIKSNNGALDLDGQVVTVLGTRKRAARTNFTVKNPVNNMNQTVYYSGPADEFTFANKENIIEALKDRKNNVQQELKQLEAEIEFQEKYENEEEYVAHKLSTLLDVHANAKTEEERVTSIKEVLETLRPTSQL